jgi:phosphoglycerate dehydrogenase-like enzyme
VTPRSLDVSASGLATILAEGGCDPVRVVGPLNSAELAAAWEDLDAAILGLDEADSAAIAAGSRLRIISRYGVGFDNVDVATASRMGIAVTVTPGANQQSVAELTIGLIVGLARDFGSTLRDQPFFARPEPGIELSGKTLGLIGLGRVGSEVAIRAAAFGMRVIYVDPRIAEATAAAGRDWASVTFDELLGRSDIVSLHCPLDASTRHLLGREQFSHMKRGAFVVNTARGGLIDEEALAEALKSAHLRGAALDVREVEHERSDDPLQGVPGLLFTPHIGGPTREANGRMATMAVANVIAMRRGGEGITGLINPEVLTRP